MFQNIYSYWHCLRYITYLYSSWNWSQIPRQKEITKYVFLKCSYKYLYICFVLCFDVHRCLSNLSIPIMYLHILLIGDVPSTRKEESGNVVNTETILPSVFSVIEPKQLPIVWIFCLVCKIWCLYEGRVLSGRNATMIDSDFHS